MLGRLADLAMAMGGNKYTVCEIPEIMMKQAAGKTHFSFPFHDNFGFPSGYTYIIYSNFQATSFMPDLLYVMRAYDIYD